MNRLKRTQSERGEGQGEEEMLAVEESVLNDLFFQEMENFEFYWPTSGVERNISPGYDELGVDLSFKEFRQGVHGRVGYLYRRLHNMDINQPQPGEEGHIVISNQLVKSRLERVEELIQHQLSS